MGARGAVGPEPRESQAEGRCSRSCLGWPRGQQGMGQREHGQRDPGNGSSPAAARASPPLISFMGTQGFAFIYKQQQRILEL